jgi:hypothetical protein
MRYLKISQNIKEYEHFFKDYYFYYNEFDLFDRKNTKIKNKFVNPHKKYNENDDFIMDDLIFFEKTEENIKGNNFSGIENESTVTFSLEQRGDLLKKNKSNINLRKFFFDKDSLMDKENSEILKEEESLNDNVLNSERKVVRVINSYNFKQRLMEFMNKN